MTLTPEQVKLIESVLVATVPPAATAAVRNQLVAVRDATLKTLKVINDTLAVIDGGTPMPNQPTESIPIPPSLDPPPEPEKKSKWAKVGGFFKKVWPVASIALVTAVPGGAAIAAAVNAVAGAGTADPVSAGAAGLLVPIGAAIVKGMEKSKE